MIKALFTSATGLNAQQAVVDNTANNLANVNTTGFKRTQVDFHDLLYETKRQAGAEGSQGLQIPTGYQVGSGVRIAGTTKVFSKGALANTDNPLDVAIEGDGFFKVTGPNGDVRYTRDGAFRLNSTGELVTADGFQLEPKLALPQNTLKITIGTDGTISAITADDQSTPRTVGNLTLTRFANPAGLSSEGRNQYSATPAAGQAQDGVLPGSEGTGTLQQNFLERSNVEVVQELVNLILAQRAYEFNTRAIKAADEMLSNTNNLTR